MKKKSQHFLLGKTATGLIAVLLLAGTVFAWNMQNSAVYAEADTVTVQEIKDVAYKVESHTDINAYRQNGNFTAPTYSGEGGSGKWIFAGWYTDQECTKSLPESVESPVVTGNYYAKYVKKEVLSVKCQLKADTNDTSTDTILRCVSSVDSLKYKNIGLELVTPDGNVKRMRSQKVGTRINARDDIELSEFTYSPKAVNTESEYFFSATERISNSDFGNGYLVKPYWITQDGTCVYGVSKYVTVNEGMNRNVVYIPVQMAEQPAENATFTANGTRATCVKYDENGGYAHLALTDVPTDSVTKYTITDSSNAEVGTYIYRNMTTAYKGVADSVDTSWYDVYAGEGESKFVIATSADLYGLATIVNDGNNLKDKTVYVVSDIDTNDEAKSYVWTRIGTDTKPFSGTFDGCMHSIKNIKVTSGTTGSGKGYGFFGQVNGGAILKNFKLIGGIYTFGQQMAGSVVGILQDATLDTVYSNAYVEGSYNYLGGLIGNKNSSGKAVVTNCWFDGTVNQKSGNSARITGGLLGRCGDNVELNNCLNTGDVQYNNLSTGALGGLVGLAEGTSVVDKLTINNCMNTGTITPKTGATANFGAIVGSIKTSDNVTIENSFAISGTTLVNGAETHEGVTTATNADLTGTKAITSIPELFKYRTDDAEPDYRWVVVANSTPVLKSFASETGVATMGVDTSWYNESDTVYVLKDAADLYGFALLSKSNNFADKTVKLGADITVNEGKADEWADTAPAFAWNEIGTNVAALRFAGSFDGQGHTIKGLYQNTSGEDKGLFAGITNASVSNLRLTNSYFKSTNGRIGSIAGRGSGVFENIYSDAIVVGNGARVGGFLGQSIGDTLTLTNCWFDGSVTNQSASGKYTGGLVGNVTVATSLTDCLNTGTVSAEAYNAKETGTDDILPGVGGLIGYVLNVSCTVKTSLNTGEVKVSAATAAYGSLIGHMSNSQKVTVGNTYATQESCVNTGVDAGVTIVNRSEMVGANARTALSDLFGENTRWTTIENGANPVLITFQDYAKVAENSSLLLWLRGKDSHTVTLANPVALSTGTWDAKKVGAQGGYTDGHYFYQAYITEQAYNQDGTSNDSNNKCHIIKQDLTGQEDIVISEELLLGHANDITYDSVNNRLVMYTRGNNLMFLDPNTLGNLGTYNLGNGISFSRMAYNASTDSYLVSLPSLANKNIPFKFLNSEFETVAGPFNSNTNTFSLTGQGASCDEQYIYLLYWDKSTKTENVIAVYDWNGNFVTSITLRTNTDAVLKEAENISVVNNTIYVMINETTTTQGRGHAEHKYVYSFCIE